ncbi:hypothetical protein ILUMI_23064, partial [Ignelater luminosus]
MSLNQSYWYHTHHPSLDQSNHHSQQYQHHHSHYQHHQPRRTVLGHQHPHFLGPFQSSSTESCPESPMHTPSEAINIPSFTEPPKLEQNNSYSSSPKVNFLHKHHNHHHHTIQELIRHFGKKVHHWRSEGGYRRSSCSEDEPKREEEEFRGRSKSLDGNTVRRKAYGVADCETTYRIYDTILKE